MRTLLLFSMLLLATASQAQQAAPTWLEQSLYGNGKINAVVAVVGIIIIGIGIWLFRMDRRIGAMEKAQRGK
jgi:type IV secretory pathway VirB2 component (pilin)